MKKLFHPLLATLASSLMSLSSSALAQATANAIALEVRSSTRNDTSQTLQSLKSSLPELRRPFERRVYPAPRLNPKRVAPKFTQSRMDTALQLKGGPVVPITLITSVDGLGRGLLDSNGDPMPVMGIPPDTNGSVGET
jgi:hypothetical protein